MQKILFQIFLAGLCCFTAKAQQLVTYPAPKAVVYGMHNDDYTVKVRQQGGEWQDLYEYNVKVDLDKPQDASMVYFDFSGTVEVFVQKNNGNANTIKIRPYAADIKPELNGNSITFTLTKPSKLSIEFDGDKLHNLHLFANPIETFQPNPKDPNVVYFGPGLHVPKDLPGDAFNITSGKTVYIAGGAVVRGKLLCDKVKNVKIIGRGIIDQPQRGVEIRHSSNVTVDGIIVVNPKHYTVFAGESDHLTIRNLKSFSASSWSDGLDFMSCSDVTVDDVFMRNSDDCIAVYGHRWEFYGDAKNYTVTNSILWADVAHTINIGVHGNTATTGDVIENLLFKNIDILELDEDDPSAEGCMAIQAADLNLVRNVRFEDIRIDNFQEGKLLQLKVAFFEKYNAAPGRGIEQVSFKNISYNGFNHSPSLIDGLDKAHLVKDVSFENLRINGKVMTSLEEANIKTGEFTENISFKNLPSLKKSLTGVTK
ncbi:Glycosyl hydrolases family 28 [Chitinophaga jiangningensis]|uniref:Glycosyl hydrolases family 28 n=1 Tax=Chitinophaga jiangningensis TaxID=1419482 RepID=A0A1M7JAH6_9BACT|nr:glycosyl hydrolase family 28 protein [Chitinophaga jiangningensis]SHM50029.1 Glycosyl hydrolases family 28 [Chitinophaga jiangningensis]